VQNGAANADVCLQIEAATAAAGFIAAILNVLAFATGCPSHVLPLLGAGKW
jgi:hypothetical protein